MNFTYDTRENHLSTTDTAVFSLDKTHYEQYVELFKQLLLKVKQSWKQLNEVERFIIKSLEFDNPSSTDEQLQDQLMYCNKKYYQYKKSGFIKLGTQLQIDRAPPFHIASYYITVCKFSCPNIYPSTNTSKVIFNRCNRTKNCFLIFFF